MVRDLELEDQASVETRTRRAITPSFVEAATALQDQFGARLDAYHDYGCRITADALRDRFGISARDAQKLVVALDYAPQNICFIAGAEQKVQELQEQINAYRNLSTSHETRSRFLRTASELPYAQLSCMAPTRSVLSTSPRRLSRFSLARSSWTSGRDAFSAQEGGSARRDRRSACARSGSPRKTQTPPCRLCRGRGLGRSSLGLRSRRQSVQVACAGTERRGTARHIAECERVCVVRLGVGGMVSPAKQIDETLVHISACGQGKNR